MIRFLIKLTNRLERELRWLLHFSSVHGFRSLRNVYLYILGFVPSEDETFDFDTYPPHEYVNSKIRFYWLPRVHGSYVGVLKNKSIFNALISAHGFSDNLPRQFGEITDLSNIKREVGPLENGKYIIKPSLGSGGSGVVTVTVKDGTVAPTDEQRSELRRSTDDTGQFVLEESVQNHIYAREIFPGALNTIRLLTAWDYDENRPFVARAAHRFGTKESAPTDNCGRGGLFSPVDVDSGTIRRAFPADRTQDRTAVHPDTGQQIDGVTIPKWTELKSFIRTVSATFPFCPWIGWDVVIDPDDRFVIIEANPTPGLEIVQGDAPLRRNESVRRFLDHHSLL